MEEEIKHKAMEELNAVLARDYQVSEAKDKYYQDLLDKHEKMRRERKRIEKNTAAIQKLNEILPKTQNYQIPEVEGFCQYSFFQGLLREIKSLKERLEYADTALEYYYTQYYRSKIPKLYCVQCGNEINKDDVPEVCFACFDR